MPLVSTTCPPWSSKVLKGEGGRKKIHPTLPNRIYKYDKDMILRMMCNCYSLLWLNPSLDITSTPASCGSVWQKLVVPY